RAAGGGVAPERLGQSRRLGLDIAHRVAQLFGPLVRRLGRPDRLGVCANRLARDEGPPPAAGAAPAPRACHALLRAVSQTVPSRAAATRTMTDATSIQIRQAAQRSASVIGVLPGRGAVEVVAPIAGTIGAPETLLLGGASASLPRPPVLPRAVEELDRPVGRGLRLDVRPPARHLVRHVPTMLAIGLTVGKAS